MSEPWPAGSRRFATAVDPSIAADFSQDTIWVWLVKAVAILVFLLTSVLIAIWFERKVVARMQVRPGPNVHGPFGLLQSLADAMKLLLKEDITVKAADKLVYLLAPMISVFCALLTFAVIPFGPAVTVLGVRRRCSSPTCRSRRCTCSRARRSASTASCSAAGPPAPPTRCSGSVRSTAQVISYELAMGLSLVSVFILAGSMSTSQIVASQQRPVVGAAAAAGVRHLRHLDDRRDEPAAVRPARGRGRARVRLHDRVLVDEVRVVLPRRVHQHDQRLGGRHDPLPRRLARPVAAVRDRRRGPQHGLVARAVVPREDVDVHVPVRLGPRHAPAAALRPVHEVRLEDPHPRRARLGRHGRRRAGRPAVHRRGPADAAAGPRRRDARVRRDLLPASRSGRSRRPRGRPPASSTRSPAATRCRRCPARRCRPRRAVGRDWPPAAPTGGSTSTATATPPTGTPAAGTDGAPTTDPTPTRRCSVADTREPEPTGRRDVTPRPARAGTSAPPRRRRRTRRRSRPRRGSGRCSRPSRGSG